ncbi:MAG: hypothetical protein AVDCRST_MAG66-2436, partial [uncultured Pseudonocardia sp.]
EPFDRPGRRPRPAGGRRSGASGPGVRHRRHRAARSPEGARRRRAAHRDPLATPLVDVAAQGGPARRGRGRRDRRAPRRLGRRTGHPHRPGRVPASPRGGTRRLTPVHGPRRRRRRRGDRPAPLGRADAAVRTARGLVPDDRVRPDRAELHLPRTVALHRRDGRRRGDGHAVGHRPVRGAAGPGGDGDRHRARRRRGRTRRPADRRVRRLPPMAVAGRRGPVLARGGRRPPDRGGPRSAGRCRDRGGPGDVGCGGGTGRRSGAPADGPALRRRPLGDRLARRGERRHAGGARVGHRTRRRRHPAAGPGAGRLPPRRRGRGGVPRGRGPRRGGRGRRRDRHPARQPVGLGRGGSGIGGHRDRWLDRDGRRAAPDPGLAGRGSRGRPAHRRARSRRGLRRRL